MKENRTIALIILDGWGHRDEHAHNPILNVNTPTFDSIEAQYPKSLLEASGTSVGLPEGQMGNSEVGHLHIGAGRKVPQDLTRINAAINDGQFFQNQTLIDAIKTAKNTQKSVHILGLVSPGGVHSLIGHIAAMIKLVHQQGGGTKNYLHAILDGRDTPPKSAHASLTQLENLYHELDCGQIASIIGRYYAMDRDKRWERIELAYNLLTQGAASYQAKTATEGLDYAYSQGQTDEFVEPTAILNSTGKTIYIEDGDVVIFMNYRADRARQLSYALTETNFQGFQRQVFPKICYITLTQYAKNIAAKVAFPPLSLHNTLGEYVAECGLKQLRIAETEKYAHVTYFINGGSEKILPGEDRILVPSPKVATYDLKPEMSAIELTDKLTEAIESRQYDLIICNYANPDMVGHTGIEPAANIAVSIIDQCMQRVITALKKVGGEALITADHGNIECMYDEKHDQPHTAHTNSLVPIYYIGRKAHFLKKSGALDDIAPTILYLLGLKCPVEMTGNNLLQLNGS